MIRTLRATKRNIGVRFNVFSFRDNGVVSFEKSENLPSLLLTNHYTDRSEIFSEDLGPRSVLAVKVSDRYLIPRPVGKKSKF